MSKPLKTTKKDKKEPKKDKKDKKEVEPMEIIKKNITDIEKSKLALEHEYKLVELKFEMIKWAREAFKDDEETIEELKLQLNKLLNF